MSSASLSNNLTLQILNKAEKEGYGVLAQTWCVTLSWVLVNALIPLIATIYSSSYDAHSVIGLVRAAERNRSPAILQLFPVTLAYGKGPFLQFCLNACVSLDTLQFGFRVPISIIILDLTYSAHGASVPIAVHLDHATDPEHIELALSLAEQGIAFDSIMVDASHADVRRMPETFSLRHCLITFVRTDGRREYCPCTTLCRAGCEIWRPCRG